MKTANRESKSRVVFVFAEKVLVASLMGESTILCKNKSTINNRRIQIVSLEKNPFGNA